MARKRRSKLWARSGMVIFILLVAVLFRSFVLQSFWIPTGSMKDTLLVGDFVLVDKMAYGYARTACPFDLCQFKGRILAASPKRGDVVAFRLAGTDRDLVKRVVGLPGDRIQMRAGLLYINDVPVALRPAGDFTETFARQGPEGDMPRCANGPVGVGGPCVKHRFVETLPNGSSHDILKIGPGMFGDDTQVFTVPPDSYFVLGDNRDNSADSRIARIADGVGFVPAQDLIGRVRWVLFSSAGSGIWDVWHWRAGRFLKAIR